MEVYTGAVLLDKNQRIYLIKEDDVNQIGNNRWNLPGGSVEANESLTDSIKRETKEETGSDCDVISLLGCYKAVKGEASWLYVVFELHSIGKQSNKSDHAVKDGKWFGKEDFSALPDEQLVHPDMKLVYNIALEGRGLSLDSVKFIKYDS